MPRSAAIKAYTNDIEEMYVSLEKDDGDDIAGPERWDDQGAIAVWLGERVELLLGRKVDLTGDLFQQGLDRSAFHLDGT